ncbi:MAG: ABC transporter permease [Syntrophomonadaceae bacterium]|nr:ABC transporter permease [Syntrophomonadaceae bacterium]
MKLIISREASHFSASDISIAKISLLPINGGDKTAKEKIMDVFEKSIAITSVALLWQLLPSYGFVDTFLLPPFIRVLEETGQLFLTGEMFEHLAASLTRSCIGFIIAIGFSIPMGFLMGWFKRCEHIADPLLQIGRNTSTLALYPVFMLIFGIGEVAKVAIIVWGTIWPTLLNTISGVKNVDPQLVKQARSMGASKRTLFLKVVFPVALPSIVTGLRLSASTALLILVAAEMIGANKGLGFMIFYYQGRYVIPLMFGGILVMAVLGSIINYLLVRLEKRVTFWREDVA